MIPIRYSNDPRRTLMFRIIGFAASVILAAITGNAIGTAVQSIIAGWVVGIICWIILVRILFVLGYLLDIAIEDAVYERKYTTRNKPLVFPPTMRERIDGWFKRTSKSTSSDGEDFKSFLNGSRTTEK